MQFKSLFVLASLAVSSFAQTSVTQVKNDINNNIAPALSGLVTAVDAFVISKGSSTQALAIHTNATNLISTLSATTNDVKSAACPVGHSDAKTILADLQALLPKIQKFLMDIVAHKAVFDALPIGGVSTLKHLASLKSNTDTLSSAIIACSPMRVLPAAHSLQSQIDAAFTHAITAFKS